MKLPIYKSLITPKLEHASRFRSPHQVYLTNALEAVQNRATRFIPSSYLYDISMSSVKGDSGLSNLSGWRCVVSDHLFHKIITLPYVVARMSPHTGHPYRLVACALKLLPFLPHFFPSSRTLEWTFPLHWRHHLSTNFNTICNCRYVWITTCGSIAYFFQNPTLCKHP